MPNQWTNIILSKVQDMNRKGVCDHRTKHVRTFEKQFKRIFGDS